VTYVMGLTDFADLTAEEFSALYFGKKWDVE
jgi:hypothetical protein